MKINNSTLERVYNSLYAAIVDQNEQLLNRDPDMCRGNSIVEISRLKSVLINNDCEDEYKRIMVEMSSRIDPQLYKIISLI